LRDEPVGFVLLRRQASGGGTPEAMSGVADVADFWQLRDPSILE
jgi:hypothetical protein